MKQVWFITGSQHLYGDEILSKVKSHSIEMVNSLQDNGKFIASMKFKGVMTNPSEITTIMKQANADDNCIGVISWMHTFSPSKMWINGLKIIQKPLLHLHTQYNDKIPVNEIDMDFMNLTQSAHGDREHGYIHARLGTKRKVISGHWKTQEVLQAIDTWIRASMGYHLSQNSILVRFGDNMRQVAVTEGDKVEAQIQFGWDVNTHAVGDLVAYINAVTDQEIEEQYKIYADTYTMATTNVESVKYQAKMYIAMKKFLEDQGAIAFTNTFEDLHGMNQLPGLATQSLMKDGFGYAGEGDWKTSMLLAIMKHMSQGLSQGTSFMEDYTYHLDGKNSMVLGSHMLEVCPTIALNKPKVEVHPLAIGGKEDPARLVFEGRSGTAILVTLVDMGSRFRMIVNKVQAVKPIHHMPNLPVARTMWKPLPDFKTATEAWILAGGAHHSVISYDLTIDHMIDLAEMFDIELLIIHESTEINTFKHNLKS